MDMESRKYKVIEKLLKVEEEDIIYKLEAILSDENARNEWDKLPEQVKKMIDIGLAQSEAGEVFPHEEIMTKYRNKYGIS